ncbi:MAG: DNA-binding PucR family transcriptional regulator [Glaciecola sp.]|jgi:DNA-binding PucR family transcriptional regulator|uniref:PucR family transcriptional regulator n=1 Tax=Congregibacter sp. TaxID=2744308 RepID=UPI0039E34572
MQNDPMRSTVLSLMQEGAKHLLTSEAKWRDQLQDAVIDSFNTLNDPAAETAIRRYNMLTVMHWANSVLRDPNVPVEPFVDPAIRLQIREQIRQGTPETILNGYRAAQILAWRAWMHLAFNLSSTKTELEALLDFSSEHINTFSQSCVELLAKMIEDERVEYAHQSSDRQYEAAKAILSGSVRDPKMAMHELGYRLGQTHQAIIIWSREPEVSAGALEAAADRVELTASGTSPLRIMAKASTAWLWLSAPVTVDVLSSVVKEGFEIAIGRVLQGLSGFKESHQSALVTQQIMLQSKQQHRVVAYDQIKLAYRMLQQIDFAQFANETLGRLCQAPADVRESLRVYLAEGANAAQAAKVLGLHRNTMNRHLERANDLLPEPLNSQNRLQVGAVLDALYWS